MEVFPSSNGSTGKSALRSTKSPLVCSPHRRLDQIRPQIPWVQSRQTRALNLPLPVPTSKR